MTEDVRRTEGRERGSDRPRRRLPAHRWPITGAKLFIAGLGDPAGAAGAAQCFSDQSPQPKRLEIVTASDHGTDLLSGSRGSWVEQLIDAWLATYLHLAEAS